MLQLVKILTGSDPLRKLLYKRFVFVSVLALVVFDKDVINADNAVVYEAAHKLRIRRDFRTGFLRGEVFEKLLLKQTHLFQIQVRFLGKIIQVERFVIFNVVLVQRIAVRRDVLLRLAFVVIREYDAGLLRVLSDRRAASDIIQRQLADLTVQRVVAPE